MADEVTPTTEFMRDLYVSATEGHREDDPDDAERAAEFDRWLAAHDAETRQALEEARVEWAEGLVRDDSHEYSVGGDCAGTVLAYWRRTPRRVIEAGSWERTDEATFEAARPLAEKPTTGGSQRAWDEFQSGLRALTEKGTEHG